MDTCIKTSDWRVPDTRPDPIILSYTRSVPDIFSESSGISGIGYYKKVGFSMRPMSFFNAFFIKMMPIFKMSPNFWPVSLWNCICGIFCTSIWTIHNNWNFKTINPKKNSTEWKSKKSQKYFLIYGIHLDIDKVILVNLAILGKVLHGLELHLY